ncbi:hypothetical protein VRRI112168_17180 [Vreelandella rituensis]
MPDYELPANHARGSSYHEAADCHIQRVHSYRLAARHGFDGLDGFGVVDRFEANGRKGWCQHGFQFRNLTLRLLAHQPMGHAERQHDGRDSQHLFG